jgi:inward rectifier potassium channel
MPPRIVSHRPGGADYEVRVMGSKPTPLRDFYHALLRLNWPGCLALIFAGYLALNAVFALVYTLAGGIHNARPGSFSDAFFFSAQTLGTIGYGFLYPESALANWLVVFESTLGLIMTALSTGLVFAKLSRPTAGVMFSKHAVISPMEGVPTLMFRIGNERGNNIVDAQFRGGHAHRAHARGMLFYRTYDLALARERALTLNRSYSILHRIDTGSPFHGQDARSLHAQEYELQVMIVGFDDIAMQTVYAKHTYFARDILWDTRLSDVLTELPDGNLVLDLEKFHEVEPVNAS